MKRSKISIVIPVYNVEKFIVQCIESILAQTFTDWELILVDDGSMDASASICDDYACRDKRIRVIHKKNGGVSSARNVGLDNASGEYVCFIDSDDWVDPSYLADFKMDCYDADVYISGAKYDTYGKTYSYKQYESVYCSDVKAISECYIHQKLMDNGYPWGKLFRLNIIQESGLKFDEKLSINEDHIFVLECMLNASSMYVANSYGYHYTVFDNSGRKLSGRINKFGELKCASETFDKLIDKLSKRWNLGKGIIEEWKQGFVYIKRLQGIISMVRLNDLLCFENECNFWKNSKHLPNDKKSRIILSIVRSGLPTRLKLLSLVWLSKIIEWNNKDVVKLIYKDLESRSTKILG